MIKPGQADKITAEDLVKCAQGDVVITMLTDVMGFWAYDNRESLLREPEP